VEMLFLSIPAIENQAGYGQPDLLYFMIVGFKQLSNYQLKFQLDLFFFLS
jgi:hypothetical protein